MKRVKFQYFPFKDIFEKLSNEINLTPDYDCPLHENGNYYFTFEDNCYFNSVFNDPNYEEFIDKKKPSNKFGARQ